MLDLILRIIRRRLRRQHVPAAIRQCRANADCMRIHAIVSIATTCFRVFKVFSYWALHI